MNGMFAFALWDRQERQLHLVRDRMGIKPLFFARNGSRMVFGSEVKALNPAGLKRDIDPSSVASFLRFGYVPAPFGIYHGLEKVMPGEIVTIPYDGEVSRRVYWSLAEIAERSLADPLDATDCEATDMLDALLRDVVSSQLVSDVPLGAFLSGGVNSSTIVALMAATRSEGVRTFSIGFPDLGFDESPFAAAIAQHLGTEHTALTCNAAEALALVPTMAEMYDEPFADSSQIPTHLVSALTRRSVTVALSGDGGDELFAGYNRYVLAGRRWPRIERVPQPLRAAAGAVLGAIPSGLTDAMLSRVPGTPPQPGDKLAKVASVLPLSSNQLYQRLVSQVPDPWSHIEANERGTPLKLPPGLGLIDRMRFSDMMTYLPDDILQKVDRASMAVALEARPPFLDHRVVEFAWRLPERFLIRNGRSKWLLREVLDRYVPATLIERPKMGFGIPLAQWLRGPLREWAGDLLEAQDYGGGLLSPVAARRLWDEHISGRRNHAYQIWTLLMFEAWRRRWACCQ
ncbi:MAG: asparagine synthase (glutamine-hydrolyzing) [Roseicyclus sp.]|uniref:asparagine synthase (glutamine-hydrolyzing) n=1 Tax=Roseicyclus sp. TaxID=1914329 RepID=UPI003A85ABD8